jgi:predicted heme/steroid binding protein
MDIRRISKMAVSVAAAFIILAGCSTKTPETPTVTGLELTIGELAEFDGKDGAKAYIAVDGVIYDVTDVREWAGGSHWGKFAAGRDLTTEIKTLSPHGVSKLSGVPVVGKIVDK